VAARAKNEGRPGAESILIVLNSPCVTGLRGIAMLAKKLDAPIGLPIRFR
jgi:hypothetical protein